MTTTERDAPTIDADEAAAELARLASHPDILPPQPSVQLTRNARGIDAAVALLSRPDGNLEDVAMLLRRAATADLDAISTVDPAARLQGLAAFVAARLRELYDDRIRTAPPAALKELVDFTVSPCRGPRCMENVLPWDEYGPEWCSAQCRNEDLRERSE
jgi:hypothetical protein